MGDGRRGAISTEDLIAYLDGEAPELARRIADDPASAALADDYARLQGGLRRALHRFDCPAPHELGEYALRLTEPTISARITAHLRDCPRCADEFRQIAAFMADDEPAAAPETPNRLRRLVATLLPTTGATGGFALRGGPDPTTRTYEAAGLTITIDLAADPRGQFALNGLLVPDNDNASFAGSVATLLAADGARREATPDEWGNFAFAPLAPGDYRLEVLFGDGIIAIDHLPIGG